MQRMVGRDIVGDKVSRGGPLPPVFAQNLEKIGLRGGPKCEFRVFLCKILIPEG